MTDYKSIYRDQADAYDQLVSREDYQGQLWPTLAGLADWQGATVAEFGAGTGRVTRLFAPHVARVFAFDESLAMLTLAQQRFSALGMQHIETAVADHRAIPLPDASVTVCIAGWALGHLIRFAEGDWGEAIDAAVAEMRRLLRPGGTAIVIETMGTGQETPSAPNADLAALYQRLEESHGFHFQAIRTDYRFATAEEARRLTGFFFGPSMTAQITGDQGLILSEWSGIWWLRI